MLLFSSINDALILIALCLGYMVLYFAKREEKGLKFIGYIIGCVVIALAAISLIFGAWIQTNICRCSKKEMRSHEGMMQQRMMHQRMMPQAPIQKP